MKTNRLKNRKSYLNKSFTIYIVIMVIMLLGIAYAAFDSRFQFNGTANIAKVNWDIHLEDVSVAEGSVKANTPAVIEKSEKTSAFFDITFIDPSEFYEFEADIVNAGTIDAQVSKIVLNGIDSNLKPYFIYKMTYSNGEEIKIKDVLPAGTRKRIKVVTKFDQSSNSGDILGTIAPSGEVKLNLSIDIHFAQVVSKPSTGGFTSLVEQLKLGDSAKDDTGINFGSLSESGLFKWNASSDSEYPIYYYRGNVTNNNVIYADMCWKIVRSTEEGNIKLVYNGVVSNGQCNNTGSDSAIGTGSFNTTKNNAKFVGYMYNDTLTVDSTDVTVNTIDSNIKSIIDEWYQNNLSSYTGNLEDAVWCNDRATLSSGSTIPFAATETRGLDGTTPVPEIMDSKLCSRDIDKFTVSSSNGNGKLDYPVGLLTADEVLVAGNTINGGTTYLTNTSPFWTMTPSRFASRSSNVFALYDDGALDGSTVDEEIAIRPAIVLKKGYVNSGDGSRETPYVISDKNTNTPSVEQSIIQSLKLDSSAINDSSINFGSSPTTSGLYVRSGTENFDSPIYYYRGNVANNNLIFANKCWKIVRTTDTGGTKLIYNGVVSNGKCEATGGATQIEVSAFNTTKNNAKFVGYMYSDSLLIDSMDEAVNANNSAIKGVLDIWYQGNLEFYTSSLEDSIWCNDRATNESGSTINFAGIENRGLNGESPSPEVVDSKVCSRSIDKFTTNYGNGNGKLEYPIGMLTADEVMLAGNNMNGGTTYLTNGSPYWTMTPSVFTSRTSNMFVVYEDGILDGASVDDSAIGVRPSIVLKAGLKVISGNGTSESPYIVG